MGVIESMDFLEIIESVNGMAEIRECKRTGEKALYASRALEVGEILSRFDAKEVFDKPNYLTVQLGEEQHIMLNPEYLQYINHSCEPNVFFDTEAKVVKALHNIDAGEEFTFFYPSTEWSMQQGFACLCQNDNCLRQIQGAAHLPQHILPEYQFSSYIQQKFRHGI